MRQSSETNSAGKMASRPAMAAGRCAWTNAVSHKTVTTVPAAIFVGYFIGAGLDHVFSTGFLKIVFVVVGTAAGFVPIIWELSSLIPACSPARRARVFFSTR